MNLVYLGLSIFFLIIMVSLAPKIKNIPANSGIMLLLMYLLAFLGSILAFSASLQSDFETALFLYKMGFCWSILFIPMLTAVFLEYIYSGKINALTLAIVSITLGQGIIELYTSGLNVVGSPGDWHRTIQVTYTALFYFDLTAIISAFFAFLIFMKGRKKFSSLSSRVIINILGVLAGIALISAGLFSYALVFPIEYYEIRYIVAFSQFFIILLFSILALVKPGFYLIYPHEILYLMVCHKDTGLLLYSKKFDEIKYSIELLSNFYSAINETFGEIEAGKITHIQTTKFSILFTEADPISIVVCSKRYTPSLEEALKVITKYIRRTVMKDKALRDQLESSVIKQEDWIEAIAPLIRRRLDMILP